MERHPAVLEPDDDLVPPDDGDFAPADAPADDALQRTRWRQPHTPLPPEYLREHAEAMTDISVPGHMLGAYPPDALLPMDTLRALLYMETTPLTIRDQVWRYLITNAIEQRGRWYVYVVGVAALRLIQRAHHLTPGGATGDYDDKRQVHQHLAVGFLAELFGVRADDERICERIVWRAVYRAKQALWENRDVPWPPIPGSPNPDTEPEPEKEPDPADESPPPDDELAPALRALVVATAEVKPSRTDRRPKLTAQDAALVALCCLYGRTIGQAAQEIGMSADAARAKLPRIKRAIFTLLASRYLHAKHPQWGIQPPADAGPD